MDWQIILALSIFGILAIAIISKTKYFKKTHLYNPNTYEIHILGKSCPAKKHMKNGIKITSHEAQKLIKTSAANGCYHCNRNTDTDSIHRNPKK